MLSSSNVPHTEGDSVGALHGDKLGPFGLRAIRDFDDRFACSLLTVDPRKLILSQIDVGSRTIRSQVSIVDRRNYRVLANTFWWARLIIDLHSETGVVARWY